MVKPLLIISYLLLCVVLDAVGDSFRFKGWQRLHHLFETFQVALWLSLFALTGLGYVEFRWVYIVIYILERVLFFDPIWNGITEHKWLYVGENDITGLIIRGVARIFKVPYEHPSFMVKLLSALSLFAILVQM